MVVESIKRGVLAGTVAGLAYGLFLAAVANPLVGYLEEHAHAGHGEEHEAAHAVTETTTAAASVGGGVLWGILLGGAFGLAYYLLEPALPGRRDVKPYVLAGTGFLTVSVAPWLVLPPATPGVEQALSTDYRLAVYGGMMLVGALLAAATMRGYREFVPAIGATRAGAASLGALAVVLAAVAIGTPTVTAVSADSAALGRAFQGTVVLSQAALWALIAGVYGHRARRRRTQASAAAGTPASR